MRRFVIGPFMAWGGTTVVALCDWIVPLSVNPFSLLPYRLMERTRERYRDALVMGLVAEITVYNAVFSPVVDYTF